MSTLKFLMVDKTSKLAIVFSIDQAMASCGVQLLSYVYNTPTSPCDNADVPLSKRKHNSSLKRLYKRLSALLESDIHYVCAGTDVKSTYNVHGDIKLVIEDSEREKYYKKYSRTQDRNYYVHTMRSKTVTIASDRVESIKDIKGDAFSTTGAFCKFAGFSGTKSTKNNGSGARIVLMYRSKNPLHPNPLGQ